MSIYCSKDLKWLSPIQCLTNCKYFNQKKNRCIYDGEEGKLITILDNNFNKLKNLIDLNSIKAITFNRKKKTDIIGDITIYWECNITFIDDFKTIFELK